MHFYRYRTLFGGCGHSKCVTFGINVKVDGERTEADKTRLSTVDTSVPADPFDWILRHTFHICFKNRDKPAMQAVMKQAILPATKARKAT